MNETPIVHFRNMALAVAETRWGAARVLDGRGPGRHPYVIGHDVPGLCLQCGRPAVDRFRIHQAPKRRKVAAFVRFATLPTTRGPGNTGV